MAKEKYKLGENKNDITLKLSPEQIRGSEISKLEKERKRLITEQEQIEKIRSEKKEISRLKTQLHPSKLSKLRKLLKVAGKGVKEAGKGVKEFDKEFQKMKKEM